MKTIIRLLLILFFVQFVTQVFAKDWPQWRGPNRDGISAEKGLMKKWPVDGPKLLWQIKDLGQGYSTPSVVDGKIYIMTNTGMEDEFVKVLNTKDGTEIWSIRVGKVGNPDQKPSFPAARSTPTVDGKVVYALGSDGDLVCLDRKSGKLLWGKSLRTDFGGVPGRWAYAESPLIDGDVLVCTPGGPEATLVALNKKTGETIWKAAVPNADGAGYASVAIAETDGVKQYVAYIGIGLAGVEAKTGKFLWFYDGTKGVANMATPVTQGGLVYSATGRIGASLIQITTGQDAKTPEQLYLEKQLPSDIGGSVLVDGNLYGTGAKKLMCIDFKTASVKWEDPGVGPGSVCYADGLLFLHGENGDVLLAKASPEAYQELGRFSPPDQPVRSSGMEKAWAYPVIADGRLYIRDTTSLWCYSVK